MRYLQVYLKLGIGTSSWYCIIDTIQLLGFISYISETIHRLTLSDIIANLCSIYYHVIERFQWDQTLWIANPETMIQSKLNFQQSLACITEITPTHHHVHRSLIEAFIQWIKDELNLYSLVRQIDIYSISISELFWSKCSIQKIEIMIK